MEEAADYLRDHPFVDRCVTETWARPARSCERQAEPDFEMRDNLKPDKVMLRIIILSTLLISASGLQAATDIDTAMGLRLTGRSDLAQSILLEQVKKDPSDSQAIFELGVAQASLGKCSTAAKTFSTAKNVDDEASLAAAVRAAMDDLCPKLDRWSISTGFNVHAGPNINGGSEKREIEIRGLPYTLSDEAMAQSGFGITVNSSIRYNFPIGERMYLTPNIGISLTEATGDSIDGEQVSFGVDLMALTDTGSLSFGPHYTRVYDAWGLVNTDLGIAGRVLTSKEHSERILEVGFTQVDHKSDRLDGLIASLSIGQTWNYVDFGTSLTLSGFGSYDDRVDDMEDLSSLGVSISTSAPLTKDISVKLEGTLSVSSGHKRNPIFDVTRRDFRARTAATVTYHGVKTRFGEPYLGVEHVISNSNFVMKNFEHKSLVAGFSRRF